MHEVVVNRLGGLSLSRKSVVRLTDRLDMNLDVYRGRRIAMKQQQQLRYDQNVLTAMSLALRVLLDSLLQKSSVFFVGQGCKSSLLFLPHVISAALLSALLFVVAVHLRHLYNGISDLDR